MDFEKIKGLMTVGKPIAKLYAGGRLIWFDTLTLFNTPTTWTSTSGGSLTTGPINAASLASVTGIQVNIYSTMNWASTKVDNGATMTKVADNNWAVKMPNPHGTTITFDMGGFLGLSEKVKVTQSGSAYTLDFSVTGVYLAGNGNVTINSVTTYR
ncbi:MAG: hypothetical protein LKF36_11995 [Lactobacillus sp.]|jgi:hypothetical protein|nr:hypothetical protein [Lactobacillus sp.]